MSEITRQFDRRFKEIDEVEARNSERYKTLEEKISEICVINSTGASMERKINEIEDKVEVITKEKKEKKTGEG